MGSRKEKTHESHVQRQLLDDPDLCAALELFYQLVTNSMGPHGSIQSIQNTVGGPITMTTNSSRLLSAMSFSQPCLRLIVSSMQGHLQNHHDGGLLTGSLCLRLILNAMQVENVSRKCVLELYKTLLKLVDEYMISQDCAVCVNVDTSNVKTMLAFVRTIIASKPFCGLRSSCLSQVAQLVLKTFLHSVPDTPQPLLSDCVFTLKFKNKDIRTSEVLDGLLLEWPEKPATFGDGEINLVTDSFKSVTVRVALVTVSMSGDTEELLTNQTEAQPQVVQSAADLVMKKMLEFCDWLVEKKVALLLCQKVIHPKVKSYLRQKGIVFIERTGNQPVVYVQDLTGSQPISSVLVPPPESSVGHVSSMVHRVLHDKSFLHIHNSNSCVSTLVLCGAIDEQLSELKSTVQSALKSLYSIVQQPVAVCGGGCWQIHLSSYIGHLVKQKEEELCHQLRLTRAQLATATKAFASALESVAVSLLPPHFTAWIDSQHFHFWPAPDGVDIGTETSTFSCACGMLSGSDVDTGAFQPVLGRDKSSLGTSAHCEIRNFAKKGRLDVQDGLNHDWLVLDATDCVVSAMHTAVMTATTVLSISQFIHDVN